jgi:hypothetical protein
MEVLVHTQSVTEGELHMKRVLVLLVASLVAGAAAFAGTVVVSGDSNLGNGIDGSAGAAIEDNGLFFSNLLGAGTSVALRTTTNGDTGTEVTSQDAILNYYGGLPGVTVDAFSAPVMPALLSGVNLLIAFLPDIAFTAGETSAIAAFLNGGGTVLFTGEWVPFDSVADTNVNSILSALGSPLAIAPASLDSGFHVASGSQIAADPLTAGISEFSYAATSGVTGGTPLFFTTNGTPFMEYAPTSTTPEPSTLLLVVGAGLGLLVFRRRRA